MAINADVLTQPAALSVACQQKQLSLPLVDAKLVTIEAAVQIARATVDPGAIATRCRLDVDEHGRYFFVVTWLLVPDPDSATVQA